MVCSHAKAAAPGNIAAIMVRRRELRRRNGKIAASVQSERAADECCDDSKQRSRPLRPQCLWSPSGSEASGTDTSLEARKGFLKPPTRPKQTRRPAASGSDTTDLSFNSSVEPGRPMQTPRHAASETDTAYLANTASDGRHSHPREPLKTATVAERQPKWLKLETSCGQGHTNHMYMHCG